MGILIRPQNEPEWVEYIGWVLILLVLSSQLRIYIPQIIAKKKGYKFGLITSDFFRYTRHPMYTFMIMCDLWLNLISQPMENYTLLRIPLTVIFYILIIFAAYYHEQEILLRFGQEAKDYYSRTPRVFIFYPFMRR